MGGQGDKGTRGQGDKGTRGKGTGDKGTGRCQFFTVSLSPPLLVSLSFYPITITDTLRSRDSSSSIRKILCQRPSWSRLSATLTQTDIGRKRALQWEWRLAGSSGGTPTRRLRSLCS